MRLYVKHIWRAFAELDGFSDEQCRRFVRAARRSRPVWLRLVHWMAQWVVFAAFVVTGLGFADAIGRLSQHASSFDPRDPLYNGGSLTGTYVVITIAGVVALAAATLGVLAWLVVSHQFLRRRIEWVLRARGRCSACRYVLVGLPVDDGCHVVCPECGLEATVDRSLGELSTGADGRERYTPSADVLKRAESWPDWRKVWKWGKRGLVVVGVVAVLVGIAAGWREVWVRRQVSRAVELKPGVAGYVAATTPGGQAGAGGDNAFVLIDRLLGKMGKALTDLHPNGLNQVEGVTIYFDGYAVAPRRAPWHDEDRLKDHRVNDRFSRELLEEFVRRGVFDDLRVALAADRTMPPLGVAPTGLLGTFTRVRYADFRGLARWCLARARVAAQADDPETFVKAMDAAFDVAELLDVDPSAAGRLAASEIQLLAYENLRGTLTDRRTARWLDAAEAVWTAHRNLHSRRLVYEGERVFSKDLVCVVFSDPDCVRLGKYSPALGKLISSFGWGRDFPKRPLGSLDANLLDLDAYYDAFIPFADAPRWQRDAASLPATDLLLVDICTAAMVRSLDRQDQVRLECAAFPVLVGIERYHLQNGTYPQSLNDAVPLIKGGLTTDPWTGKPWGYRRADPAKDELAREFLLYSYGRDGVDDGGSPARMGNDPLYGRGMPCDFIVNDNFR